MAILYYCDNHNALSSVVYFHCFMDLNDGTDFLPRDIFHFFVSLQNSRYYTSVLIKFLTIFHSLNVMRPGGIKFVFPVSSG